MPGTHHLRGVVALRVAVRLGKGDAVRVAKVPDVRKDVRDALGQQGLGRIVPDLVALAQRLGHGLGRFLGSRLDHTSPLDVKVSVPASSCCMACATSTTDTFHELLLLATNNG